MKLTSLCAALLGRRRLRRVRRGAAAQDIKLGYNGDLSASPSAQSGQAAVLGMEAAIADINAAGGVLGKKLTLVVARRHLAAAEVDPEHERPDRQREGRRRVRPDQLRQRDGLEAHRQPEEDPGASATSARAPTSPSR